MPEKILSPLLIGLAALFPIAAHAVMYDCPVQRKVDSERVYSPNDLKKGHFSVRIEESGPESYVSRCSFTPSEGKDTCDRYKIDRVEEDETAKIKKYYLFRSHFDVQLFSNLSFVENNGRGGIAYGTCRVIAP